MITGSGLKTLDEWERKLMRISAPLERAAGLAARDFRKEISKSFDEKRDPYGTRWKKRKGYYKHPVLQETRAMRRGWRVLQRGPGKTEIVFMNVDPKHIYHQYGTESIDVRAQAPDKRGLPPKYKAILKMHTVSELSRELNRSIGV